MDEEFDVQAHVRESALKAFQFRRAIKVFDPGRDIPAADLDVIWEAARLSPTSNGLEPFNLIVLRDERVRARLKEEGGGGAQWVDAPVVVVITSKTGAQLHADSSYLRHMKLDVQGFPAEQLAQRQQSIAAFLRDKHG
ncbi:MAG: nitroreductase family protein, partial [Propionibacteriaceae bacterium]|nr:nitroreductase family protein [Propionibacteriaceae bacterium]